jgi:hypothetical protein
MSLEHATNSGAGLPTTRMRKNELLHAPYRTILPKSVILGPHVAFDQALAECDLRRSAVGSIEAPSNSDLFGG